MNWRRFFQRAQVDAEQRQELEPYIEITGVLVVAALAASYIPTRRAAAVDPVETLRGG